jgi:hypothetical protein
VDKLLALVGSFLKTCSRQSREPDMELIIFVTLSTDPGGSLSLNGLIEGLAS